MKLGDFFKSATHCRPVNPKPVTISACARGSVLPGGETNPSGLPVISRIPAALVFIGGHPLEDARMDARTVLRNLAIEKDHERGAFAPIDQGDFEIELTYQFLHRVVWEWNPEERKLGGRLFEDAAQARELVLLEEANRVVAEYNAYVLDEHPEVASAASFRGAEKGSKAAPSKKPDR